MKKNYSVSFCLFDVTQGEKRGDLLDQSDVETIEGLRDYERLWAAYCADSPVEIPPPQQKATRVALSRNGGAAIMRARFEHDGRKYLVQMRVETQAEIWRGEAGGETVTLALGAAPVLHVGSAEIQLSKVD